MNVEKKKYKHAKKIYTPSKRMTEDRRTARLSKQPEIEVDDDAIVGAEAPAPDATQQAAEIEQPQDRAEVGSNLPPSVNVQHVTSNSGTACSSIPCLTAVTCSASKASDNTTAATTNGSTSKSASSMTRKQTLTRTQALEGTSPPPDTLLSQFGGKSTSLDSGLSNGTCDNRKGPHANQAKEFLMNSRGFSGDSGRGTMDNDVIDLPTAGDSKDDTLSLYKDASGVDLPNFFKTTFHKSLKDRKTLLNLEKDFLNFISDPSLSEFKLNEMNTYDRMVAHRVASYFGLDHNIDQSCKCVVVKRTAYTRIPVQSLQKLVESLEEKKQFSILPRKATSLDEKQNWTNHRAPFGQTKTKSLEEREQQYEEARLRILGENTSANGAVSSNYLSTHQHPYMQQQRSLDSLRPNMNLLSSQHPAAAAAINANKQPWSSTESGYGMPTEQPGQPGHLGVVQPRAPAVTKSHSYGGGPTQPTQAIIVPLHQQHQKQQQYHLQPQLHQSHQPLNQPHLHHHVHQQQPSTDHMLIQQLLPSISPNTGSGSVALVSSLPDSVSTFESPVSVLSNRDPATPTGSDQSLMSRPSSETGQSPMGQAPTYQTQYAYIVSPDLNSIPPGCRIINPQTMEPHLNPDGTEYRFDPACPPPFMNPAANVAPHHVQTAVPPSANMVYSAAQDRVAELTNRFAGASLTSVEAMAANPSPEQMAAMNMSGQPVSFINPYGQSHFAQPVYYNGMQTAVRYVSYQVNPAAGQQVVAGPMTMDGQGAAHQAGVPMSMISCMPSDGAGVGAYQMVSPAAYGSQALSNCVEYGSGAPYQVPPTAANPAPVPGRIVAAYPVGHQPVPAGAAPTVHPPSNGMLHTYHAIAPTVSPNTASASSNIQPQPQPSHHHHPHQQASHHHHPQQQISYYQYSPTPSSSSSSQHPHHLTASSPSSAATFYTGVPLASPGNKPPSPHSVQQASSVTAPPPPPHPPVPPATSQSQQQQQQQQAPHSAIYYNPSVASIPVSPMAIPMMPATSTPSKILNAAGLGQNSFGATTPPQPQQQQNHHHHHQHNRESSASTAPHRHHHQHNLSASSTQHGGWTPTDQHQQYSPQVSQAVTSNGIHQSPAQVALTFGPQHGPQHFVPIAGAYAHPHHHQLRPMGTHFIPMAGGQPGSYQIIRPAGAAGDVRFMSAGGFRPRNPYTGSYGQMRPKSNNQNRNYGKGKKPNGRENPNAAIQQRNAPANPVNK